MSNPYDLKKKKSKAPKIIPAPKKDTNPGVDKLPTHRAVSLSDNIKRLEGYKEVPNRIKWKTLPIGAEIRYMKKDGSILMGGAIIRHGEKEGRPYLVYYHPTYKNEVVLYHDNVQKIWAKASPELLKARESSGNYNKNTPNLNSDLTKMKMNLRLMNEFMVKKYGDEYRNFMRDRQRGQ